MRCDVCLPRRLDPTGWLAEVQMSAMKQDLDGLLGGRANTKH
jgi:hypothetical protein